MLLWFLCPGTPEGSTDSGSSFNQVLRYDANQFKEESLDL